MNKEKINYFIYARKSSEAEGQQVLSIPAQLESTQKLVEKEQLTIIDTITDARSAKTPYNRPQYSEMITRIKKGEASGIVVWHLDRLARNSLEWGEIQYLLQIGTIKSIWTLGREYLSQDSILLMSVEAGMATQYSIDLSRKVKHGIEQKVKMGQPTSGIAKLGYLNTKFAAHGTNSIVIDPDRWNIMRKGFDLMLSRQHSVSQIADILNFQYGLKSKVTMKMGGRPISKSMLYRTFTDPFYYGYFRFKGQLHKGSYTPMITIEEFEQVQQILKRVGKPKQSKHTFAYTGLIKCGICGCAITATKKTKIIKSTGEEKTYIFYHCTKRRGNETCAENKYVTEAELEGYIAEYLKEYSIRPSFREFIVELLIESDSEELEKQKQFNRNAIELTRKLEKELDVLLDLLLNNTISEEIYLRRKKEKEHQLIQLKEKQRPIEETLKNGISVAHERLDYAMTALTRFKAENSILIKKEICFNFGQNWTLIGKNLVITPFEWLHSLKYIEDAVRAEFGTSELDIILANKRSICQASEIIPYLSCLRNDVRPNND